MSEPFDLRRFLIQLFKHWKVLLVGTLAGALIVGGGYLFGKLVLTRPQYEMRLVVHENLWYNDELGQFTYINAYTWTEMLGMDLVAGNIALGLGDGYTKENVAPMLRAEMPSDTRVVYFYVKDTDPERVMTVFDKARTYIPTVADDLPEIKEMLVVDESREPYKVNMIKYWQNAFRLGAVLGLVLSCFGLSLWVLAFDKEYIKQ